VSDAWALREGDRVRVLKSFVDASDPFVEGETLRFVRSWHSVHDGLHCFVFAREDGSEVTWRTLSDPPPPTWWAEQFTIER
jgi:hypothetical protein